MFSQTAVPSRVLRPMLSVCDESEPVITDVDALDSRCSNKIYWAGDEVRPDTERFEASGSGTEGDRVRTLC